MEEAEMSSNLCMILLIIMHRFFRCRLCLMRQDSPASATKLDFMRLAGGEWLVVLTRSRLVRPFHSHVQIVGGNRSTDLPGKGGCGARLPDKGVLDSADRNIDRGGGQKQGVGGNGIGRRGLQPLFVKGCAGIHALVDQMHGRAEITPVLFHQRPITAHLAAIGGIDAGVEIDDRAAQGLKGCRLSEGGRKW